MVARPRPSCRLRWPQSWERGPVGCSRSAGRAERSEGVVGCGLPSASQVATLRGGECEGERVY